MFTFVQAMEGVDFKGALKILADKAGVELVREDPKKRDERDTQYAIIDEITAFFAEQLDSNPAAKKYVLDRGVTDKTIQLWRIGFAPDEWRAGRDFLLQKKHTDEQLRKAGLVKGDPGKDPYDVFRNRVMFPMNDPSGRVVAFSGRTLSSDKEAPKYVNSPETELFKKSELLYGYDKARQGIRKFDFSLIVEGQFDVVLAHQSGYNNTVAVSGTALTTHHVQLLQRLSNRVVLALDADRAGLSAVKRAADVMLARGMDVKVARMPEGKDPADIIKEDPQQFKDIIGHSVTVIEHLLNILKQSSRDERAFLLEVREDVLPRVIRIPSELEQEHFAGLIADKLGFTKDAVMQELIREREKGSHKNEEANDPQIAAVSVPEPSQEVAEGAAEKFEEYKTLVLLLPDLFEEIDKDKLKKVFNELLGEDFEEERESISFEREIRLTKVFKKQNSELAPKERKRKATDIILDMYKAHLNKKMDECRLAGEHAGHFELRRKKEGVDELEFDLFI